MNRVVFENELELITFTLHGQLLHTPKTTFDQRHSLDTWPDLESAKEAFETGPGQYQMGRTGIVLCGFARRYLWNWQLSH
jgi:hypothetical protein